jgi:uncharacterized membrane protein YeaQ/YmgE (transglycosylase-associated protein family)
MEIRIATAWIEGMSILVWIMVGIAIWHFAVLVPDRFWGGIIGAFLAAVAGALLSGYVLPVPGIPTANPPGIQEGLYALPGAVAALAVSYWYGSRRAAPD